MAKASSRVMPRIAAVVNGTDFFWQPAAPISATPRRESIKKRPGNTKNKCSAGRPSPSDPRFTPSGGLAGLATLEQIECLVVNRIVRCLWQLAGTQWRGVHRIRTGGGRVKGLGMDFNGRRNTFIDDGFAVRS